MIIEVDNSFNELADEIKAEAKKVVDQKQSFRELRDMAEFYGRRGWQRGSVKDIQKLIVYSIALIHKAKNTED